MNTKNKIELINNYISLHKVIWSLKYIIFHTNDESPEETTRLTVIATSLKSKYDEAIAKFHLIDESFINLTSELKFASQHTECFSKSASFIDNKKDISSILNSLDISLQDSLSHG